MYGRIHDAGLGPCRPRAALIVRTPGWGLAMKQWSCDFHTVRGGIDPEDHCFVCCSFRCMEGFMMQGWDLILSGWRWLCEPQVRVPTSCEAVSTRGTSVSSPFRQLCCKA